MSTKTYLRLKTRHWFMSLATPLFIFSFLFNPVFAQERNCQTYEIHQQKMITDPAYNARYTSQLRKLDQVIQQRSATSTNTFIKIPVVVHVVYNTSEQNISDEQVKSQIDVLNEDYSALNVTILNVPSVWQGLITDSQIRFELASRDPNGNFTSGVTRTQTSITEFAIQDPSLKFDSSGGKSAWPDSAYLNIWVCKLEGNALGYATFPNSAADEDGVVISYTAFGRVGNLKSPYNYGRTSTHEIGHWLNLAHIWGDDGGTCSNDDQVSDTPKQGNYNFRCQVFPKTDNCTQTSPGIMYMNYMDYTDDFCMMFFTPGQITRMQAVFSSSRTEITSSVGCQPTYSPIVEVTLDSVLLPVITAADRCFNPSIRIRNNGISVINSLSIVYSIDGGLSKKYNWTGVLNTGESTIVVLPYISGDYGDQLFETWIEIADSNTVDNYMSASFRLNSASNANCETASSYAYPNPSIGVQSILLQTNYKESQQSEVSLYNMLGQLISTSKMQINPGDVIPIDLVNLSSGMYMVQIAGDPVSETIRFINITE